MRTDREGAGIEASDADVQEQQRDVVEDPFDAEQTTQTDTPDASSTGADPADVQEQSIEVEDDDEDSIA